MSTAQITPAHLARKAAIYIRQSSPGQVLHNRESQRLRQHGPFNGWSCALPGARPAAVS